MLIWVSGEASGVPGNGEIVSAAAGRVAAARPAAGAARPATVETTVAASAAASPQGACERTLSDNTSLLITKW
jgi:hypothetical protein